MNNTCKVYVCWEDKDHRPIIYIVKCKYNEMKREMVKSLFSLGEKHSLLKIFCQFDQMQRRNPGGEVFSYWCSLLAMCLKCCLALSKIKLSSPLRAWEDILLVVSWIYLIKLFTNFSIFFTSAAASDLYWNDYITKNKARLRAIEPGDTQHRLSSSSQGTQRCGHTWSSISPRTISV